MAVKVRSIPGGFSIEITSEVSPGEEFEVLLTDLDTPDLAQLREDITDVLNDGYDYEEEEQWQ